MAGGYRDHGHRGERQMKINVVPGSGLTAELVSRWRQIQIENPSLDSPYFCPEFVMAVTAVRRDVYVGIIEDGNDIAGFFPFQCSRMRIGGPVGGPLSDIHGVVAPPDVRWTAADLIAGCGLSAFEFHHLLASQQPFMPYHAEIAESHCIDLSNGFGGYTEHLRRSGSHLLKDIRHKQRRLAREFGAIDFQPHVADPAILHRLLRWKSEQYRRSGLADVFSHGWTTALLERIHAIQTPGFAGMLSALFVDGRLVAAHMGMRSRTVWNWWFPRHDERYAKCSPGILLRVYAAEAAPRFGVRRVDLGLGDPSSYKSRLRTGSILLATGRVELPSFMTSLRRLRRGTEAWVRSSPLLPVARIPGRLIKRAERRRRFH